MKQWSVLTLVFWLLAVVAPAGVQDDAEFLG